jgi:hypothetical protein
MLNPRLASGALVLWFDCLAYTFTALMVVVWRAFGWGFSAAGMSAQV